MEILKKSEIIDLLSAPFKSFDDEIFKTADLIRRQNVGDAVLLRGLIEFSNYCNKNCLYCGLRTDNKNCIRYRLNKEEIIKYAKNAAELGLKTVVLQSGEDCFFKKNDLIEIIEEIKKTGVALTLSIGERYAEDYEAFKNAGADRFLMRIETTDEELYKKMHPPVGELASHTEQGSRRGRSGMVFENRKKSILKLKELGFELGTGSLIGLPGQTLESIANDILFFKEVCADMVGVGPFISNPDTPLKNAQNNPADNFELTMKVVALIRIILPKANIPATTAMETIHPNGRLIALQCGANVVMPNVVDYEINKNYQIYKNKSSNPAGIEKNLENLKKQIETISRYAQ